MISADRFTVSAQDTARRAAAAMQRYEHNQVDVEHVLLALIEQPQGTVSRLLEFLRVDTGALYADLDALLHAGPTGEPVELGPGQVLITPRVARMIDLSIEEAGRLKDELVSDEHLFLAIVGRPEPPSARLLEEAGLTHARTDEAVRHMRAS